MGNTRRTRLQRRRLEFSRCLPVVCGLLLGAAQVSLAVDQKQLAALQELVSSGQHDEALARIEQQLEAGPEEPTLRFYQGLVYARQNRIDQAIAVLDQLSQDYPDLPEPRNNLAVLYAARGDYDNARRHLMAAIGTHPSYATAHENLGDLYSKLAADAYDKALLRNQNNATAGAKLAMINELFSASGFDGPTSLLATQTTDPASPGAADSSPITAEESVQLAAGRDAAVTVNPGETKDAFAVVVAWAEAWSAQRFDDYIAKYASAFAPGGDLNREQWLAQRRTRLSRPKFIEVRINDPKFALLSDGRVRIEFWQTYRSDTYEDATRKVLVLGKEAEQWRIFQEGTPGW